MSRLSLKKVSIILLEVIIMIFSERLKELRESKKISMYTLAKQLGVSDAAICKWENAVTEPKASNIKNLSEFFEVSSDFLLGLEDELGIKKYSVPPAHTPDIITSEGSTIFSQKLKELRTRDDISQAKFAREVGFSQSAIASWENETREPGINALIKIAQYFNTSVDYLIGLPTITPQTEKPTDFSADELNLIKQYRLLQTGYQTLIAKQIDFLLEQQKASHYVPEDSQTKYKKKNN